ncbi:hypothetical protein F511_40697 [Dorcoceras hygrometricum]|uniref:Uncharacterized protein n=1 Tax=Dorcoceras hygrometricum TaxID=472368 RepID=A0A2Z7BFL4_9LAMI|nr:hypothetical protein F511_40697 [Dorcoceras hygrometricum]
MEPRNSLGFYMGSGPKAGREADWVGCDEFWACPLTRLDRTMSEYPVEKPRTIPIDLD